MPTILYLPIDADRELEITVRTREFNGIDSDPKVCVREPGIVELLMAVGQIREHTTLRAEQAKLVDFVLVPDLDRAGARGAALAARSAMGDRA